MRDCSKYGVMVRVLCLLTIALVCAMGIVQAVHAHRDDTSAPHHVCSICSTAHARLGTEMAFAPPVLAASALAVPTPEFFRVSRDIEVHFIRPPPSA